MRKVVVLCLVAVLVAACSGGSASDEARSSTTTTQVAGVDPVVPAAGRVLAEVKLGAARVKGVVDQRS